MTPIFVLIGLIVIGPLCWLLKRRKHGHYSSQQQHDMNLENHHLRHVIVAQAVERHPVSRPR